MIVPRILDTIRKGGQGSGNFDHAGRPGLVGGSAPTSEEAEGRYPWQTDTPLRNRRSNEPEGPIDPPNVTVYHGTTEDVVRDILKEGIVAGKQRRWSSGFYSGKREKGVFATYHESLAREFALDALANSKRGRPGSVREVYKGEKVVVFEVKLPKNVKRHDDEFVRGSAFFVEEKIPVKYIRGYNLYEVEVDKYGYVSLQPKGHRRVGKEVEYIVCYVPVLIFEEEEVEEVQLGILDALKKGGHGSGNFNHAGRPGLVGGSTAEGGEGRESTELYHGTARIFVDDILKNGIIVGGEHQNYVQELLTGKRGKSVYLTDDLPQAKFYGKQAALNFYAGFKTDKNKIRVAIFKVSIPDQSKLESDEFDTHGYRIEGDIPKEWIKGYTIHKFDGTEIESYNIKQSAVYYVPVLFIEEDEDALQKGGSGSGNFGHAGRPGLVGGSSSDGEEARAMGRKLSDRAYNSLIEEMKPKLSVFDKYEISDHVEGAGLTEGLRDGKLTDYGVRALAKMDSLYEKAPKLKEDTMVHRTMEVSAYADTLLKEGNVFRDEGFVSTTYDKSMLAKIAQEFGVGNFDTESELQRSWLKMDIIVPKGTAVMPINSSLSPSRVAAYYNWQKEVLLPRSGTFTVVKNDGKNIVLKFKQNYSLPAFTQQGDGYWSMQKGMKNFARNNRFAWREGDVVLLSDEVVKGGPGSGHFGHAGRPGLVGGSAPGDSEERIELPGLDRRERAKFTYKPVTPAIRRRALRNELLLTKDMGGKHIGGAAPFDVQIGSNLIEVKTVIHGENDKITMHKDSVREKNTEIFLTGMKPHTIIFDDRNKKVYYREGIGSFRLGNTTEIGTKQDYHKKLSELLGG